MGEVWARASRRLAPVCGLIVVAALAAPRALAAQSTTLTLTSNLLSFATPTLTDYAAGYVCAGAVTASLAKTSGANHNDALLIRLGQATPIASTPAGFDKPLADFQYSTDSDPTCSTGTWASVPASNATGATVHASARVPYTQIIYFRLKVSWTTDRGGESYALPAVNVYVNAP
jgi:hypothetical protein